MLRNLPIAKRFRRGSPVVAMGFVCKIIEKRGHEQLFPSRIDKSQVDSSPPIVLRANRGVSDIARVGEPRPKNLLNRKGAIPVVDL